VWTVLDGGAAVEPDGQVLTVGPGDTLILPADAPRRVSADPAAGFAAIAVAPAGTRAYTLDGTRVAPGCAVPDGDKLVPAWVV
jgi:quercetin dioxygenase-like cupin family protein